MKITRALPILIFTWLTACASTLNTSPATNMGELLAQAPDAHWRRTDPAQTLYLELKAGRVVIELAPEFAPRHVANLGKLVDERYFDGLAIIRSHDNFVVQWGDPHAENPLKRRSVGAAEATLAAEFTRQIDRNLEFIRLPEHDGYAAEVGFSKGFPVARDRSEDQAWLAHCYAMVGAGRGNDVDSGGGTELYVVTGHAPRQLDRNITLIGRVIHGIELLSALPRGTGALGFYEKPEQYTPIVSIRLESAVPESERSPVELLRTDSESFARLIEIRRNRKDDWYKVPAAHIDLCSVPLPARKVESAAKTN